MPQKNYKKIDKQIDRRMKELVELSIRFGLGGRSQRIKIKGKVYSVQFRCDEVKIKKCKGVQPKKQ